MTTARINQHTPHSTAAVGAAVILLCLAAIVAIALHAPSGYATPTPGTVHTPSQDALRAQLDAIPWAALRDPDFFDNSAAIGAWVREHGPKEATE